MRAQLKGTRPGSNAEVAVYVEAPPPGGVKIILRVSTISVEVDAEELRKALKKVTDPE
ncbi:MAG: hypothetical protein WC911_01815 [Thermoleophilia bacterium]